MEINFMIYFFWYVPQYLVNPNKKMKYYNPRV